MKRKRTIPILGTAIVFSLVLFGVISTNNFKPVSTNAQTNQGNVFETINQKARENNLNPSFAQSEEIASMIIDNLSILYIPKQMQTGTIEQIATAHLNGLSYIDENNIVASVNDLAERAQAPDYAYTNVEQVKVVRTFLHRLMPDLVSSSGEMTDLEAFAVFTATVSQKVDNDAFMVAPEKFSASLQKHTNQPFPGSSESISTTLEVNPQSDKADAMLNAVDNLINSPDMLAPSEIVVNIGIQ